MAGYLQLTKGKWALLDDDWHEILSQYNWQAMKFVLKRGHRRYINYYAARWCGVVGRNRYRVWLHRLVTGMPMWMHIKFLDGNRLNCQRENMRLEHPDGRIIEYLVYPHNPSLFGVEFNYYECCWSAVIHDLEIGKYMSVIEAAEAYNEKAKEIYGASAKLNDMGFLYG